MILGPPVVYAFNDQERYSTFRNYKCDKCAAAIASNSTHRYAVESFSPARNCTYSIVHMVFIFILFVFCSTDQLVSEIK